jgi:hypothetical protein
MLSGCGHFSSPVKNNPLLAPAHWEGRLQVRVLLANPELFSANFEWYSLMTCRMIFFLV